MMMRLSLFLLLLLLLLSTSISTTDASLLRKGNERQLYDESDLLCFNIETAYSAFGIDPAMAATMSNCANGNAMKSDY
eukprot:CAMPEP_0202494316 /NCGR_PEP_ID=MMETSP1361-20130828/11101_1 /ASSEMBLY_ACC=CAM_ASM_000849 /TAXON_ID=210615 /ORGANISM="Staurosira complex sp., Strain CCMP2646" /LENGTH=77 /DNA_ID=CAMNT_0049124751 /DNA_START=10 /DNA_END=240 /DNA_ORIENTATION=-